MTPVQFIPANPVPSQPSPAEPMPAELVPSEVIYGVKVTDLYEGTAARQGLRPGDIILSFDGTPTPTFEALRDAVQAAGARAELVFINSMNGRTESMTLYPENGRIGLGGEPVRAE